ncbi:MAG: HAD family phosphatase [Anaerolineales bacterium]|nr:HAD family phosphatase [Anaerolineales bacterium]
MTNSIHAIIFDLGNVLIGWDAHLLYKEYFPNRESVDHFLEEVGFLEWNAKQDAGRPFAEGVEELSNKFPHHAELIQAYDTHWEKSITEPYSESVEIVRALKDAGWALYLLSNFSLEKYKLIEPKHSFLGWFKDKIISGEHGTVKPEEKIFHILIERIGYKPENCLFIDDSLPNIETAQRLGFKTIHFNSPTQLKTQLLNFGIKGIQP